MKKALTLAALAASCIAAATPAVAQQRGPDPRYNQISPEEQRFAAAQQRFENEYQLYLQEVQRYREARRGNWRDQGSYDPRFNNDPRYNGGRWDDRDEGDYDAARYYREGPRYRERVLRSDERVYRGRDGRYYCRRDDGTTGLIVGAVAGATLGNIIDGGHSRTAGTLIGAIVGGVIGQQVDANSNTEIRCR